jgi:hypothetical protein
VEEGRESLVVSQFSRLSEEQERQLACIEISDGLYYPALVELVCGQTVDCVYVAEAGGAYGPTKIVQKNQFE